MLKRLFGYSVITAGAVMTGISLKDNGYDINSIGIVRLSRAAITVFKVGTIYKTQLFNKKWDKDSEEYKIQTEKVHRIAAKKLLDLCCVNRGVYIKVGQHIGSLDYLLPDEYVETMKVLHHDAPKTPVQDLYKVVKQDLKKDPNDIFVSIEDEPLGTASLAQVHKATLKNGDVVAVKIQHPYVKGNALVDMKTMELLVNIMTFLFREFNIQWLVDETKKNLPRELDFLNEGRNAEKLATLLKNYKWLKIPKIYWNLSTDRVLVMEFVEGGFVTDRNYMREHNIDPFEVSNKIGQLYSDMIFTHGFVHSDPHPGNILVQKTKSGSTDIILLDHGLYATLTDHFKYEYSKLWLSILRVNVADIKEHAMNLGINEKLYGVFACMVTGRSWSTILQGVDRTKHSAAERQLVQARSATILPRIASVLEQVDRQMLLILKTNDLIRGIESTLRTQDRMTAFWAMSKCCIRSVYNIERNNRCKKNSKLKSTLKKHWEIFKLNIYYLYLGLVNFTFISAAKQIFF